MPLEQQVVVRATPLTIVVIFLNACFLSVVFVGGGLALALHRHHQTLVWACTAAVAVGWTLTATRLRARFTSTGIEARNAFRSLTVPWPEVVAIRLIPAVWNCADPGWAATMLEVETVGARRFPIRCCTHLRRGKVTQLSAFLDQRAAEFHFESPRSMIQL